MTEQERFHFGYVCGDTGLIDEQAELKWFIENCCSIKDLKKNWKTVCNKLNELHEEKEWLKKELSEQGTQLDFLKDENIHMRNALNENKQLKQDNNALIHLLENQSIIIQELHSKLLEYQVKEPIVLTKEDLGIMGKAIGYYSRDDDD